MQWSDDTTFQRAVCDYFTLGGQLKTYGNSACCARAAIGHDCAAEQGDERAALHSITSSASASNLWGISTPSAFAVARLMTRSILVASSTGMSAGFAPLRIRPA